MTLGVVEVVDTSGEISGRYARTIALWRRHRLGAARADPRRRSGKYIFRGENHLGENPSSSGFVESRGREAVKNRCDRNALFFASPTDETIVRTNRTEGSLMASMRTHFSRSRLTFLYMYLRTIENVTFPCMKLYFTRVVLFYFYKYSFDLV